PPLLTGIVGSRLVFNVPLVISSAEWVCSASAAPTSPASKVTSAESALLLTFRVVGTAPTWPAVGVQVFALAPTSLAERVISLDRAFPLTVRVSGTKRFPSRLLT